MFLIHFFFLLEHLVPHEEKNALKRYADNDGKLASEPRLRDINRPSCSSNFLEKSSYCYILTLSY